MNPCSLTSRPARSLLLAIASTAGAASAQVPCPDIGPLLNWTGTGALVCTCFVPGEEAGAILDVPANHYPIEILRVGIGWGSQFGGAPQTVEESIHIYAGALPNPGAPIFSIAGPQLTDGFINVFDLEPLPGDIILNGGPFTVTLEFLNNNAGQLSAPSVAHDGNGCQPGKNVVFAIPGGWNDACALGVTGDWQFQVVYRRVNCPVNDTFCVSTVNSSGQASIMGFAGSTSIGANDLTVLSQQNPSGVSGLFFYGPQQAQMPFGDGFRCVAGGVNRIQPALQTDIFGNALQPVDYTLPPFNTGGGAITAGSIWNFQFWFRDVAAGMSGFNLSNGLMLTFVP